jgi:MFS transporter, OFA family, oxalate/formate antiporter
VVGSAAIAGLGASLFALTYAPVIARVLVRNGLDSLAASLIVMTVGFFMIRFTGQGVLELVSRTMLLKWYDDRRGLANAIFSGVMPVAFSLAPLLLNQLISGYGWQGAWRILGFLLLPGGALIALLTFSDPDRTSRDSAGAEERKALARIQIPPILLPLKPLARRLGLRRTSEPMSPPVDRTLAEAMHHLAFWVFIAATTMSSGLFTGLTFPVVGVFAEAGIGRGAALAVFFPTSIVAVVALTGSSVISDFVRLKYFVVVQGAAMALTLLSLAFSITGSFHLVAWLTAPLCAVIALLGFFADNPNRRGTVAAGTI